MDEVAERMTAARTSLEPPRASAKQPTSAFRQVERTLAVKALPGKALPGKALPGKALPGKALPGAAYQPVRV